MLRRNKFKNLLSFSSLEKRNLLATIVVNTFDDVTDAGDGLTSLREAITQSNSNGEDDTVVLGQGVYQLSISGIEEDNNETGDLDILPDGGNRLTILGAGSELTTVDANMIDRAFESRFRSKATMEGFTITNGSTDLYPTAAGRRGGGLSSLHTDLSLNDIVFTQNQSVRGGSGAGALYVAGGTFEIENSTFTENTAGREGNAILIRASVGEFTLVNIANNGQRNQDVSAVTAIDSNTTFSRSKIDNNVATGIKLIRGTALFDHVRMFSNTTIFGSSAIENNDAAIEVEDSRIVQNRIGISGTGPFAEATVNESIFIKNDFAIKYDGLELNVFDSEFVENRRGIQAFQTTRTRDVDFVTNLSRLHFVNQSDWIDSVTDRDTFISDITMAGSSDNRNGIAVRAIGNIVSIRNVNIQTFGGIGISAAGRESLAIVDSVINEAQGIDVGGAGDVTIGNTEITNNFNTGQRFGGAIANSSASLTISNSLIAGNSGRSGEGGIFRQTSNSGELGDTTIRILSSTIINNRTTQDPLFNSFVGLSYEIHNSILWNNFSPSNVEGGLFSDPGEGTNSFNATNNIVSDEDANDDEFFFDPSLGNLDDAPRFVDFSNSDFRLRSSSPAVDAGDTAQLNVDTFDVNNNGDTTEVAPDLDLLDRVVGSTTDIGAFEFV